MYTLILSPGIQRLRQSGFLDVLAKKWFSDIPVKSDSTSVATQVLEGRHIALGLILYGCVIGICVATLIAEIAFNQLQGKDAAGEVKRREDDWARKGLTKTTKVINFP